MSSSTVEMSAAEATANSPRYRVVTQLGAGGTANVHLAMLSQPGGFRKLTVLKSLQPHRATDAELVAAFRNEARLAARLKHPNLVEVYEVLEDHALPVLAMEYLEGGSLREIQRVCERSGTQLPFRHHLEIIERVCAGLHYCHRLKDFDGSPMGLVHRDISPHNVFVTTQGQTKLLDFGIAKVVGLEGDTQTGVVKGKVRYMAPEQMSGDGIDHRADIYAIGVLLWEAAAGRSMWNQDSEAVVMRKTINGEILPPDPVVEGCPPEVVEVAMRCLETDPDRRISSCEEIQGALAGVLAVLRPEPRPLGAWVQRMFEDRLAQIQAKVSDKATARALDDVVTDSIEWYTASATPRSTPSRSYPTTRPRRWRMFAVVGSLAVAASAMWLGLRGEETVEPTIVEEPPAAIVAEQREPEPPPPVRAPVEEAPPVVEAVQASVAAVVAEEPAANVEAPPNESPTRTKKPRPKKKAPITPTTARPRDCSPPYYIDDAGVKHFKRDCL